MGKGGLSSRCFVLALWRCKVHLWHLSWPTPLAIKDVYTRPVPEWQQLIHRYRI